MSNDLIQSFINLRKKGGNTMISELTKYFTNYSLEENKEKYQMIIDSDLSSLAQLLKFAYLNTLDINIKNDITNILTDDLRYEELKDYSYYGLDSFYSMVINYDDLFTFSSNNVILQLFFSVIDKDIFIRSLTFSGNEYEDLFENYDENEGIELNLDDMIPLETEYKTKIIKETLKNAYGNTKFDSYLLDNTYTYLYNIDFSSEELSRKIHELIGKNKFIKDAFDELCIYTDNNEFLIAGIIDYEEDLSYNQINTDIVIKGLTELRKELNIENIEKIWKNEENNEDYILKKIKKFSDETKDNICYGYYSNHSFVYQLIERVNFTINPPKNEILL